MSAKIKNSDITGALQWRYATKTFDPAKKVSEENMKTILESGRLAPSSVGLEPWKFIVVNNPEIRAKLRAAAYDQTKVTDASHIVVIANRTDGQNLTAELIKRVAKTQGKTEAELAGLRGMAEGTIGARPDASALNAWLSAQTYIPLGIMMETAALLGVDSCPMEGFDPKKINEILGLPGKNLSVSTMLAIGYRGNDDFAKLPKTRRSFEEVVEVID